MHVFLKFPFLYKYDNYILALMSTSNITGPNFKYMKNICLLDSANQIKGRWCIFVNTHWLNEKQSSTTQMQHCNVTKDAPLSPLLGHIQQHPTSLLSLLIRRALFVTRVISFSLIKISQLRRPLPHTIIHTKKETL